MTIKVRLEGFLLCVSMCVSVCGLHLYFGGLWAPLWICSLAASGLYVLHLTCALQTHRLNALLDTQNYVCVFRSFWLHMCHCMQYYNKNPKGKLLSSIPFEAIAFHYFHRQECIWMQKSHMHASINAIILSSQTCSTHGNSKTRWHPVWLDSMKGEQITLTAQQEQYQRCGTQHESPVIDFQTFLISMVLIALEIDMFNYILHLFQ